MKKIRWDILENRSKDVAAESLNNILGKTLLSAAAKEKLLYEIRVYFSVVEVNIEFDEITGKIQKMTFIP